MANPNFGISINNTKLSIENGVFQKSSFEVDPEETSEETSEDYDSEKSKDEEWNPNADPNDPHGIKLDSKMPNQMLMMNPCLRNKMSNHEVGLQPTLRKSFIIVNTTSTSQRKVRNMSGQIKRKRRLRSDGKRSNSLFVLLEKKAPKILIENIY